MFTLPLKQLHLLGRLYESYSESNAMYDDEIKADFHALYEAMNGIAYMYQTM